MFINFIHFLFIALFSAIDASSVENIQEFLSKTTLDLNNQLDDLGRTFFIRACKNGSPQVIELFLKDQRIDVNQSDTQGRTGFYYACNEEKIETVKLLLKDERVDINQGNDFGYTPLIMASLKGNIPIIKILIASFRDLNILSKTKDLDRTARTAAKTQELAEFMKSYASDPEKVTMDVRNELKMSGIYFSFL